MWIGTDKGLSRFDGFRFEDVNKGEGPKNNIYDNLLEDRHGNIWVGGRDGLSCFSTDGMMNYPNLSSMAGRSIFSIVEGRDGKIWFGTSRGLSCFDGKKFQHFNTGDGLYVDTILSIAVEKAGKLWLGTDRGIYCYERKNFIDYFTNSGLLQARVSALLYDSRGNLLIGTRKGLYCYREGKLIAYTTKEGLCHNFIKTIMEDSSGNTWIGTWNGVSLFSGGTFINYSTKNGLPNNFIYWITEDREGDIWFGTHGGASCLTSLNVNTYMKDNGLSNNMVIDIIRDQKERYWFGTSEGLSCYSRGNFKNYTTKDGLINNAVNALMEDRQGKIWISTLQGLSIFSSSFTNYTKKDGLASNILFGLLESRDGTVWIGTANGITRCINGKFSAPPFHMKTDYILRIIEDIRGNLWFFSQTKLYKYTGKALNFFSTRDDLPGNGIDAIFADSKGNIWVSTDWGLSCYDYDTRVFTHYNAKNSNLLHNACYCIQEDRKGNLWIGGPKGVTCFDGKEFKAYTSERLGLSGRSWLRGITDNRGALWFGTTEGVTTFNPPPVKPNTTPPPVYITGIKVMEKEVPLAGTSRFAYDRNIFRFNFVGISFSPPGVEYKYMLENIDNDWQFTKDRSLFYPFLPPGSYKLKVKAINCDGVESTKAAEYRFKILPPFWQTWWFLGLVVLVLCLFLVLVIHWRVKRIREKAEMKARKTELEARNRQLVMSQRMELMGTLAAGTVHDLKNLMAVIIGYSRVIGQKLHSDEEDFRNIEIIKETAATAVQMAKQILSFARIKSHPQHEDVELGMELTEILDTLRVTLPANIQVLWEPPSELIHFPIHPARFQQLVMNLCLNSCQAMPNGGKFEITLSCTGNNEIVLEIADTGTGITKENLNKIFDPLFTTKEQDKGTGLGLFVVKRIVDEYRGKIEVRSEPGKGTTFVIRFPDNQDI